jgi:Mg/Co/Ni transporter MgtE
MLKLLLEEFVCGAVLGAALAVAGYLRVYAYPTKDMSQALATAIAISLLLIVFISILVGAALPLLLNINGMDPAHAGPAVQVIMDVTGVLITCTVASAILD